MDKSSSWRYFLRLCFDLADLLFHGVRLSEVDLVFSRQNDLGAVFGWLGEGIVVKTVFEMLPLSISFTALAWHALITVWVGWYAVQKSFIAASAWSTLIVSAAIGVCYGLWAIMWWNEPDGGVSTISEFALFSAVTTAFVILAYGLAHWSAKEPFVPNRWLVLLSLSVFAILFLVSVPAIPISVIVLPVLLCLAYVGLRQNRLNEREGSLLDTFSGDIPITKYLSLLAIPAMGIIVYAIAISLGLRWQTNWVLYLITTPLGFILFGMNLYKSLRPKVNS